MISYSTCGMKRLMWLVLNAQHEFCSSCSGSGARSLALTSVRPIVIIP